MSTTVKTDLAVDPHSASHARLVSHFFLAFLFVGLITPWNVLYEAIYYLCVVPLVVRGAYKHPALLTSRDTVVRLSLLLIVYVPVSSFLVSDASLPEHLRQFRWALETLILVCAMIIVVPVWYRQPGLYGRLFLGTVLAVSGITVLAYLASGTFPERLEGYGFLDHSIIGPAVLAVLWAIGLALISAHGQLQGSDLALILLSLLAMGIFCLLTMSRGPILSLLAYVVFVAAALLPVIPNKRRLAGALIIGIIILLAWPAIWIDELQPLLENMVSRGASHRFDIWLATLNHPPASFLFGEGYATYFQDTPAGQAASRLVGIEVWHPHNLLLSVWYFSGLTGATLFLLLLALVLRNIFASRASYNSKVLLLGLFLLMISLNMTRGHLLVASPDPVWLLCWVPVIFMAIAARQPDRLQATQAGTADAVSPGL